MNLLVTPVIWQIPAQNDLRSSMGFPARGLWHSINPIADNPSRTSACTTQYRYPSPSKRFGTFGSGPLFFWQKSPIFEQRMAEKPHIKSGDSLENLNLLCLPVIKTIVGGTIQCRSNTWPWLPFLLHRSPVAWITTSSARVLARLRAPLLWALQGAVCSPVLSSVQARVRCATMLAYATNLTQNAWAELRFKTTTDKLTTAKSSSRWFFVSNRVFGSTADLNPIVTKNPWLAIDEKCDSDARLSVNRGIKNRCRDGAEYLRKAC